MTDNVVQHKILSDKATQLLSSICNVYAERSRSPYANLLISEDCPRSSTLSEENVIFKTHIIWDIKKCQLDEKLPGKYIESSSIEISSLNINYLWFRLYPKGKNSIPQSLDFCVHFRHLPENVYIVCDIAFIDDFKNVILKKTISENSDAVKENTINFLNLCPYTKIKSYYNLGKLKEKLTIQCRMKLFSRIYSCVSEKITHTVKTTPEVCNLNSDILKNEKYSDVTLLTESIKMKSHKFLLASESPSLHILMKVNHSDELELEEKHSLLQKLLKYMYTEKFCIFSFSDAVDYYTTSYKFEVLSLKNLCTTYLIASLTENNISYVWDLSRRHQDNYLLHACVEFVKSHNIDTEIFMKMHI